MSPTARTEAIASFNVRPSTFPRATSSSHGADVICLLLQTLAPPALAAPHRSGRAYSFAWLRQKRLVARVHV